MRQQGDTAQGGNFTVHRTTGEITEVSMTRAGSKTHTAQVKREDKVREFMNTEDWQNMLSGVFVIPKGVNLQF